GDIALLCVDCFRSDAATWLRVRLGNHQIIAGGRIDISAITHKTTIWSQPRTSKVLLHIMPLEHTKETPNEPHKFPICESSSSVRSHGLHARGRSPQRPDHLYRRTGSPRRL